MIKKINRFIETLKFCVDAATEKNQLIIAIRLKYDMTIDQYQLLHKMTILELTAILNNGFKDDFYNN